MLFPDLQRIVYLYVCVSRETTHERERISFCLAFNICGQAYSEGIEEGHAGKRALRQDYINLK